MYKALIILFAVFAILSPAVPAQVPIATQIRILKAEDERRYDKGLKDLLKNPNARIRTRAALAAGRIGDEKAIPALASMLEADASVDARAMAAFALGETESMLASDAVLKALNDKSTPDAVLARVVEAAGKIVGANAARGRSKMVDNLGDRVLDILKEQENLREKQSREVVLAGLTAALRAHARAGVPGLTKEEIEAIDTGGIVARFLTNADARIRADAANTISRARYKKASERLRSMLRYETDPVARANAARALGSAEDKEAFSLLLKAAIEDSDSRVRVSAIRSLGALKDPKAADKLLERGENLLKTSKKVGTRVPAEKNELLEIATVLGRLLHDTKNEKAIVFLDNYIERDGLVSPEITNARIKISQSLFTNSSNSALRGDRLFTDPRTWRVASTTAQAFGELANLTETEEGQKIKAQALSNIRESLRDLVDPVEMADDKELAAMVLPDLMRAFAAFKTSDLPDVIRPFLTHEDLFVRAAAAEILADQPASKENVAALKTAFTSSLFSDKVYNDAQLGILDALYKLDKKEAVGTLLIAAGAPDYLVRKKAIEYLGDKDLQKDFPGIPTSLENLKAKGKNRVLPYTPAFGTKLGQVLNTTADYTRAASRKNGQVKAVLTTDRGVFTIDLLPEDAPLTVDNFIRLARSGYFNGVPVHRVVPNFVMQDGDPRGDGNGGPGWSIRCELNMVPYDRGAVGMALSGKDTGGSQWFVTHAPQPHLDGGYTVFGHVNDADMKVVDNIARGDKIISVKIVEGTAGVRKPAR
jgi:cyclophilin family peptidyl-prolyl cis-trans isomerase/HEAT repeat protein